jgi:protein-tyrosine phosphatase
VKPESHTSPSANPPANRGGKYRWLLFVCTGNYYRSRFAEAFFNHHAEARGLTWQAFSPGLGIHAVPEGDLSEFTREALAVRAIDLRHTGRTRVQLSGDDLDRADAIIALDENEHRAMVMRQFPGWEKRMTFWSVQDLPWTQPVDALLSIEELVLWLLDRYADPNADHSLPQPLRPEVLAAVSIS